MNKKYAVTFRNSPQKSKASSQRASNQQVFGIHAIIEAIESGKEIESLYVQRDKTGELIGELKQFAKDNDYIYIDHWKEWVDYQEEAFRDLVDKDNHPNNDGANIWATSMIDYFIAEKMEE